MLDELKPVFPPMSTKLPTLLDNRNNNTVLEAFHRLLPHCRKWDVATGYFEVGSLLALDGAWQKLDSLRVVLGDEMTDRTRRTLLRREQLIASLREQSEQSIEQAKEADDALTGLDAVHHALQTKHLQARVYAKAKFHAKGYLMEGGANSLVDYAVVGSSNFTQPGLTQNIELNVLTTEQHQIQALKQWYEEVWNEAEDVSPEILKVIERHLHPYTPFEVYAKALYEYFAGREKTQTEWERHGSVIYPLLSKYQQDGYHRALQIAEDWHGALICDGVGLGKTFIGLMLIEQAIHSRKKVLLVVPKSTVESVWKRNLDQYIRPRYRRQYRDQVEICKHTDFGRDGTISEDDFKDYCELFDVVIVDEAHHFRHHHRTRAKKLMQICRGKRVYLLTATPINNSLVDLYNLINFFAQSDARHFARLGIQNLRGHFTQAEKRMKDEAEQAQAGTDVQTQAQTSDFLRTDTLLKAVLIQRSRRHVMDSEALALNRPCFPERQLPVVVSYSLNKVYAGLYEDIKLAFDKDNPLLSLAVYNTEAFKRSKSDMDKATLDYQSNVVGLIRTLLLKRLESSYKAFEASMEDLLHKMAGLVQANAPDRWEMWKARHLNLWNEILINQLQRAKDGVNDSDDEEENDAPDALTALDAQKYDVDKILAFILEDMSLLVTILTKVHDRLKPQTDDKLTQLTALLQSPDYQGRKLILFTEFRDTARYLYRELQTRLPDRNIEELDSTRKIDREKVIKRFAPYYNCTDRELPDYLANPIDLLISTDVLSEGLNLQDANTLLNYDVHWNPVRLMQRVGRVDRRMDMSKPIHHDKVYIVNFLPPQELEDLLKLLKRVSGKILRINRTLGIEAPILRPDDPEAAMKLFNAQYEQQENISETLERELQKITQENPALAAALPTLPLRLFSGKRADAGQPRGLFCAYRFPAPAKAKVEPELDAAPTPNQQSVFSPNVENPGDLRWYWRDADTGIIGEGMEAIANAIRCAPDTPRVTYAGADALRANRQEIERQKVNRALRDMQVVAGDKATLVCWMEVC